MFSACVVLRNLRTSGGIKIRVGGNAAYHFNTTMMIPAANKKINFSPDLILSFIFATLNTLNHFL